jgi:hypothetical protein
MKTFHHSIAVLTTSLLLCACDSKERGHTEQSGSGERVNGQSGNVAAPNPSSGSPNFLTGADWKKQAFGELEFSDTPNNVIVARFWKVPPGLRTNLSLGTRSAIPVLCVLKDDTSDYPEAVAIIRSDGKLSGVSETGRRVADLGLMNISSATVRRIHEAFNTDAFKADNRMDEGMYEGIAVLFPSSCLPLSKVEAVRSHLRGLFVELILEKIQRLTGKSSESLEVRGHAWMVKDSQSMLFAPDFPAHICVDADGMFDPLKAMRFMLDPAEARKAVENDKYAPLNHNGEAGLVVAVDKTETGIRIIIQTDAPSQRTEYNGVLATNLKVGDPVRPQQIIGVVTNARVTSR